MSSLANLSWSDLLERLRVDLAPPGARSGVRDEEAWREVRSRIRYYAERVLAERSNIHPEDVEDIVQAVLLKLQLPQNLERLRAARFYLGYLVVMIRNAANDLSRRRSVERDSLALFERAISQADEIHEPLERRQARLWLARELRLLRPDERELLVLRFGQGMQIAKIAQKLQLPYSRVAVRLFRLLRKLESRSRAAGMGAGSEGPV
jgi:RNA polymerase sigma factor (sigma-70 family)